jgi:hypothetical protein
MSPQNSPERPSQPGLGAIPEAILSGLRSAVRATSALLRERRLELVTVAAILGAALLAAAEFLDLYQIVDPNGALVAGAKATQTGGEHHSYALLVIGVGALGATLAARWSVQPAIAVALGALGAIALAIVLIGDLPDVTSSGLARGSLEVAQADPRVGFWLELAGAIVTLVAGLALARLLTIERTDPAGESPLT